MEKTINIPEGVEVRVEGMRVTAKGPKGELSKDFDDPRFNGIIKMSVGGNKFAVSGSDENRKISAMVGTIAAHVRNMTLGVSVGYKYELKILYTHFPITVSQSGSEIQVKNFLGEKSTRTAEVVGDVHVKIDKEMITVTGNNVEEVGQTAANIEYACRLSKRDRRIFTDGIFLASRQLASGERV